MVVQILKDIFTDTSFDDDLDALFYLIEEPHSLYLKEEDDIDALMESSWYAEARSIKKKIIYELIVKLLQDSENVKPKIKISHVETGAFSLPEAIRYLRQPFSLILENSLNDSKFFLALVNNFPKYSSKIKKHIENGWLVFDMGGGSTIIDLIQTKLRSFNYPIFKKENYKYLRCYVLLDSDKRFPEEELNREKRNLIEFFTDNEIPFHVLEKREVENYLPDEVFSEINDNRDYIDAYLRLNPIQKDYFDIEKGFSKKFEQLHPEVQALYNDISDEDKKFFRKSSLESFNSNTNNFKSDFPELFLSTKVTKENLLNRCKHHSNELPEFLQNLSSIL